MHSILLTRVLLLINISVDLDLKHRLEMEYETSLKLLEEKNATYAEWKEKEAVVKKEDDKLRQEHVHFVIIDS